MKTKLVFLLLAAISLKGLAQTKTMVSYYDWLKTMPKMRYDVLVSNPAVYHGSYKEFHRNTVVAIEGNFNNGYKTGKWTYRWEHNGKVGMIENYNDKGELHGNYKEWGGHNNVTLKKEGNYVNGLRVGVWKEYYGQEFNGDDRGSTVESITVYNDKETVSRKKYYRNGQLEIDDAYVNGENVSTVEYFENGQKYYECSYKNLEKTGAYSEWYRNGNLYLQGEYVDGKKMGRWTKWYKNGNNKITGTYDQKGRRSGKWMEWNENGQITSEAEFKDGIDIAVAKAEAEARAKAEAEAKAKAEYDNKLKLIKEKETWLNERGEKVTGLYKVLDKLLGNPDAPVYRTKKKKLYNAYLILEHDLLDKINKGNDPDEVLQQMEDYGALLDKMIELIDANTKDLQKALKNQTDPEMIKEILGL